MADLDHQDFMTVQSDQQQQPNTIASAASIVLESFLTYITGTVAVATIAPPTSGLCMVALVFTDAAPATMTTTGNILNAIVPTQDLPTIMIYDPRARKWRGFATNLT